VSRFARVGLVLGIAALFLAWHSPLLTPAGRVRGFTSDTAIIALMGKKLLEGRGFDVFFWGQNYVGPLTSMFIAGAGAFLGGVDPLALRAGTLLEVFAGILLVGWGIWPLDRRAAMATMLALTIGPPVLLQMMIAPLGAEMAFVAGAALFALLVRRAHPLLIGVVAGIGWWMNQQVVFTLLAAAIVLALRSPYFMPFVRSLRPPRGRLPGITQALVWVLTGLGVLLLAAFVICDLAGIELVPFLFGRATDALLLVTVPHMLLALLYRDWRHWTFPPRSAFAPLAIFAAGFMLGYAPVWLGRILGWYEPSYVFAFRFSYPSDVLQHLRAFGGVAANWIGITPNLLGALFVITFLAFLGVALKSARTDERRLLALIPLGNLAFYLFAQDVQPHYFIGSVGMLFALAALGACELWDSDRRWLRSAVAIGAVIAALALGTTAKDMHRNLLREPDPLPLLARVEAARCEVCYADFWIAYRYRLLDRERRGWIPYRSRDRTGHESEQLQRRPGQRCLIEKDGRVVLLDGDLPLRYSGALGVGR
jgi:hypothetical protein